MERMTQVLSAHISSLSLFLVQTQAARWRAAAQEQLTGAHLYLDIAKSGYFFHGYSSNMTYVFIYLNCIFANLQIDCDSAIDWFTVNCMKANPYKFQFLVISSERIEQKCLGNENGITLRSEPYVKS